MRSIMRMGLALASFVLLKGDGCGETVARATCDGAIARLDLTPRQCVQVPNCFVPADRVYDTRYRVELRSLSVIEPATSTVSMDAGSWLSATFNLPAGARDVDGFVQVADGMSLRVCAKELPPVKEAVTRIDLFVSKPEDASFVAGMQQVDVRVAESHPFRGVITPEDDPSKVDSFNGGDGLGMRTILRQDSTVKFTVRGSGGKPLGRQFGWSVEAPLTLDHTDGPDAWITMSAPQTTPVRIRLEVRDPGQPIAELTWEGYIQPVGSQGGTIQGPTRVYPGGMYEWTRRCWQSFTNLPCRGPSVGHDYEWYTIDPDGVEEWHGEEDRVQLRLEKVGTWVVDSGSAGRVIVTSTF